MKTDWKFHKNHLLQDPRVRQAYNDLEIDFQKERTVIEARLKKAGQSKQK